MKLLFLAIVCNCYDWLVFFITRNAPLQWLEFKQKKNGILFLKLLLHILSVKMKTFLFAFKAYCTITKDHQSIKDH